MQENGGLQSGLSCVFICVAPASSTKQGTEEAISQSLLSQRKKKERISLKKMFIFSLPEQNINCLNRRTAA